MLQHRGQNTEKTPRPEPIKDKEAEINIGHRGHTSKSWMYLSVENRYRDRIHRHRGQYSYKAQRPYISIHIYRKSWMYLSIEHRYR